jgi:hypothetical protein
MFKILENIPKVIAWLQIAASPVIICLIGAFFIYAYIPNSLGVTIAIITILLRFVLGIIWARKVEKQKGTVEHMSGVIATRELDHKANDFADLDGGNA